MLLFSLNGLLAGIFAIYARRALMRGATFFRHGLLSIRVQVENNPDFREQITARRAISEGGTFVIGGLLWLIAGAICAALSLYFVIQVVNLL